MPTSLGTFQTTDAMTTPQGWDFTYSQRTRLPIVYVNNQSQNEYAVWGINGAGDDYLDNVPAWVIYVGVRLRGYYTALEFRPVTNLAVQGAESQYVSAVLFETDETDPGHQPLSLVRQVGQSRQVRTVAVPIGFVHWGAGHVSNTVTFPVDIGSARIPSAAQLAAGRLPIYLYYAVISPDTNVTGGMVFVLEWQWLDAGGANVGSPFVLTEGSIVANSTALTFTQWTFAPTGPLAYIGANIPAGAVKGILRLDYVVGAKLGLSYTIISNVDPVNLVGNPDIGVQAEFNALTPTLTGYF